MSLGSIYAFVVSYTQKVLQSKTFGFALLRSAQMCGLTTLQKCHCEQAFLLHDEIALKGYDEQRQRTLNHHSASVRTLVCGMAAHFTVVKCEYG